MSADLRALRERAAREQEFEDRGKWSGGVCLRPSELVRLLDRLESAERERDAAKTKGALLSPLAMGSAKRIDELIAERDAIFEALTAIVHAAGGKVCVGANSLLKVKSLELTRHEEPGEFHTVWSVSMKQKDQGQS